jgi:PAS domain S-box-containing protein
MPGMQKVRDMQLRFKLLAVYLGLTLILFALGGLGALYLTQRAILSGIESELDQSTRTIINMVQVAAHGAIKNYLRAVAERNLEIADNIYKGYLAGQESEAQVRQKIRSILLGQTIGKTGYICCINSQGGAVVHPRSGVEGNNWSHLEFIRQQTSRKTGYLEYQWQNPGETAPRPKALYMTYFEPFDWIISATAYREEFNQLLPMQEIRRSVKTLNFGSSGYAFILDREGNILVHPELEGRNVLTLTDGEARFFDQMQKETFGQVTYWWKNPGDSKPREKLTQFGHIPELNWIIGSSGYLDEIYAPIYNVRNFSLLFIGAAVVLSVILTLAVSNSITRRLSHLMTVISRGDRGDLTVRAEVDANDEIGRLSHLFNGFLERLQFYHQQLGDEVDQHRSTTRSLRQAHDFNALILSTVDALVIVVDPDGRVVSFNRACEACSGYTADEIQGHSFLDTLIPAEEKARLQAVLDGLVENRKSIRVMGHWITKDGNRRLIQWSGAVARGLEKNTPLVVCAGIDITDQKAIETALQKSEAQFEAVFNQTFQLIGILAPDGTIRGANQTALDFAGIQLDDILGLKLWESPFCRHASDIQRRARQAVEQAAQGTFIRTEVTHVRHDGDLRTFDFSLKPVRDEQGQIFMLIPESRDITAQKEMEAQLLQSKKMDAIGILAGGIAHDFNNNLQAISGYTQLLLMDDYGSARQKEMLITIQHACDHGRELTRQLLTFSRKVESRLVPLDLNAELEPVVKLLRHTLPRMIEIDTRLADDLCGVEADPTQFEQMIMNLGINAGHAMPDGGRLSIVTRNVDLDRDFCRRHLEVAVGSYVLLSITDTGHGMDADTSAHIFEPFFTTRETGEGTGLGLAMVYGIVKNHRGAITCQSEPGQGTTFNIYFPALTVPAATTSHPVDTQTVVGGSESILVVDDETYIRELARELLQRYGYRVREAIDGEAALSVLQQHGCTLDLILLDLNMPGMGGVRCLQQIRTIAPSIPVLIASGYTPEGKEKTILDDLANGYVNKPYNLKTFLGAVRQTLDHS